MGEFGYGIWTRRHCVRFAVCFVGHGDLHSELIAIRWMPHQCGPSYDAPTDCTGLRSDMLFFTNGFVLWSLPLRIKCSIYSSHALGIPSFDESNVALNFTADWQGFLKYGFEQSLDMDASEATRSGQINLFGSESDDLYPFDWYVPLYLFEAFESRFVFLQVPYPIPCCGRVTRNKPDYSGSRGEHIQPRPVAMESLHRVHLFG